MNVVKKGLGDVGRFIERIRQAALYLPTTDAWTEYQGSQVGTQEKVSRDNRSQVLIVCREDVVNRKRDSKTWGLLS